MLYHSICLATNLSFWKEAFSCLWIIRITSGYKELYSNVRVQSWRSYHLHKSSSCFRYSKCAALRWTAEMKNICTFTPWTLKKTAWSYNRLDERHLNKVNVHMDFGFFKGPSGKTFTQICIPSSSPCPIFYYPTSFQLPLTFERKWPAVQWFEPEARAYTTRIQSTDQTQSWIH